MTAVKMVSQNKFCLIFLCFCSALNKFCIICSKNSGIYNFNINLNVKIEHMRNKREIGNDLTCQTQEQSFLRDITHIPEFRHYVSFCKHY